MSTHTYKDRAHIHADSHSMRSHKLLNQFKSAACSFPAAIVPVTHPPPHTCKPEYFTNTPITRSLPAAILIHYDGFILAIFSICPL